MDDPRPVESKHPPGREWHRVRRGAPSASALIPYTQRREATSIIERGNNTGIAGHLVLGEGTVKTHIGHTFTKLDLRDRAAAAVFAFDHGLLQPRRHSRLDVVRELEALARRIPPHEDD